MDIKDLTNEQLVTMEACLYEHIRYTGPDRDIVVLWRESIAEIKDREIWKMMLDCTNLQV